MDPVLALAEMHLRELRTQAADERLATQLRRARRAARPHAGARLLARLRDRVALRPEPTTAPCGTC